MTSQSVSRSSRAAWSSGAGRTRASRLPPAAKVAAERPSGIASSWRRSATVSGPAFQACRMRPSACATRSPCTPSNIRSTPGDRISLS